MAQRRFTNYKAPVESFPLGEQHVGIFRPGRYNGFDLMETEDNITLTITHSGIITKGTPEGNAINIYGALITPTGLVIHEEGPIQLNLPPNSPPPEGETQVRTFLLVCEHRYQPIQGGVPASYFLIANPNSGNLVPEVPNPKEQVALGVITKDYAKNTLTYKKVQAPQLGDTSPFELYNLIKDFIEIPEPGEMPSIEPIVIALIEKNKPRTIVTGIFDLADSDSASMWQTIPYNKYVDQEPGHNIEDHTVRFKQTRQGGNTSYVDVEIYRMGGSSSDPLWTWKTSRLLTVGFINKLDQGQPLWAPLEIRDDAVTGSITGSTVRRFQLGEGNSRVQDLSLRLVIQNYSTFQGSNIIESGEGYLIVNKNTVQINTIYPYPQTFVIDASGPWTATSDNPQITFTPQSGAKGKTTVSAMITATSGKIEGIITFKLTGGTETAIVKVSRNNLM